MVDVVSRQKRSEMMSGIRSKNTRPELLVRKALHRKGFRFRIHCSGLPGKPDLAFSKYNAVIFTHGCFWHGHGCPLFKWPSSRPAFWRNKINWNKKNDRENLEKLRDKGLRVLIIWECALKGRTRREPEKIFLQADRWLKSRSKYLEITGKTLR